MDGKTIALVASYYGPYGGNFISSLLAFDEMVKQKNGDIVYIFPEDVREYAWVEQVKAVSEKIYFIPYKPHSFDNIIRLRKIFNDEKVDLIFSRMGGWDLTVCLAKFFTPTIWLLEYALDTNGIKNQIKMWIKYKIVGYKTYHAAVSVASAAQVNEIGTKHKCVAIPNALDFSRLRIVQKNDKEKQTYQVLIFAYNPIVKGLDIALDAIENANLVEIKYRLLVSAQSETHQYLNKRYPVLPDWIQVLEATNDISSVYEKADIMLSASRHEGFSYCLAEAIFSGLPVVYSDIVGTAWAREFRAVYQFKTEDATSLEQALNCCHTEWISEQDKSYNRELMIEKYSMDAWCRRMQSIVDLALDK